MDAACCAFAQVLLMCYPEFCVGGTVSDLAYIGLTILVFAVLYLILKGVEHFER